MTKEPKFKDGEKVLLNNVLVTIKEWSYVPRLNRFTYTVVEHPSTFFFENEFNGPESIKLAIDKCRGCTWGTKAGRCVLLGEIRMTCKANNFSEYSKRILLEWLVPNA